MSIGFIFWLLMLLVLIFGVWGRWPNANAPAQVVFVGSFLEYVLFFLLGWAVFGFIIKGP